MGCFDNILVINWLHILRFPGVADTLILRRHYGAIASPLRCNRVAVTVQSRCDYSVTATRLHRNGKTFWQKTSPWHFQMAEGYPFSALNAPVPKC